MAAQPKPSAIAQGPYRRVGTGGPVRAAQQRSPCGSESSVRRRVPRTKNTPSNKMTKVRLNHGGSFVYGMMRLPAAVALLAFVVYTFASAPGAATPPPAKDWTSWALGLVALT